MPGKQGSDKRQQISEIDVIKMFKNSSVRAGKFKNDNYSSLAITLLISESPFSGSLKFLTPKATIAASKLSSSKHMFSDSHFTN